MATIKSTQGKEGLERPPSKDDVIAMLKSFQDHIDSGGGIAQNEEGDDFVEIQEEWDADGNVISNEGFGLNGTAALQERVKDDEKDSLDDLEQEEVEFDDDAFESMMQEMEELELAAAEEQSSGAVEGKPRKHSNSNLSAKSPAAAPGMKRGFLLPSVKRKPRSKGFEKEMSTADTPTATTAVTASRPLAFTGAVVERQPDTATSRLPSAASSTIDTPHEKREPQKVSKFKQRMYGS